MKKIIYIVIFTIITITTFSQQMVVQKTDGTNIFLDMNTIETINFIIPCPETPTVDYDGKIYNTVLIGEQCWLKENLDVGTMISGSSDQNNNGILEKYCYNNALDSCTKYGGLYQWNEAMQYVSTAGAKGICPTGWHIPTLAEFQTLTTTVANDGNALKAIGQGSGSGAGTNTSGFSALLAGHLIYNASFSGLGNYAIIWSSTEYSATDANYPYLTNYDSSINLVNNNKGYGFSVRCLKN